MPLKLNMATVNCFSGPEELEDSEHALNLLKELKFFYDSRLLVDVTIEVEPEQDSSVYDASSGTDSRAEAGKVFQCNRNILAAASPYFKSMFTGGLYESTQSKITIHDVDPDSMAVIIDYCYTGKVTITEGNVQRLYAAANMLQLEYIRHACADFMTRRLDLSNCTGILKFADTFDNLELKSKAQTFIAKNFAQLCASEKDLCELDMKQMKEILSLDSLDVDCERKVCSVAIHWIENNLPPETEDALHILKCVRWSLFTEKDRVYLDSLKSKPLIQKHLSGFIDSASTGEGSVISKGLNLTKQRIGKSAKEMVLFFGRPNEPFMCYDPYTEEIYSMASPVINLSNQNFKRSPMETFLVCATPENNLYLASHLTKHFWVYNPLLNCWQELAERLLARMHSYVGYLNGHLYILGGRDPVSDARLKEVECYSILRNQWMFVAPLPHSLGKMQVVTVNERLYVVNKRRMLCYEPKRNHWVQRGSLKRNKLHKACVFQEQIICLCDIPVVKAYNPARGEWRRIGDIPIDSSALNYQVVQHNNKLLLLTLAIAHHNKNRLVIHEYDSARDTWKNVVTMFGSSFGSISLSARVYTACLSSGQNFITEEDDDSGSSADWDFDGLTDADSDSGSSSSFSDENW
ncbi:kelch repeat and BTB domain-containing protein 7 [Astyanax mexicanus]|uniref:Kelch repeat and BTB domain containing 7 n=1 Tax=Astyanax mexicanus TaxID=7994 RepID=A0A8B9HA43_ASTMX|nr:kelch repeat and BTB domain-containing protein 7 [Astyanax mexicanus]KAG9271397.1 kelch repeat and BTB domain-containing protein 7 [Astyanax mexicanus]